MALWIIIGLIGAAMILVDNMDNNKEVKEKA